MLVLSTLEYGSSACSSARLRNFKKLHAVHQNGIRIALGAFRSSRIANIMCESGFKTLSHRRERQIANSAVRMMYIKNHQINNLIEDRTQYDSYSDKPQLTKPFFIRVQDVFGRLDIDLLAESTMDDATNNLWPKSPRSTKRNTSGSYKKLC
jgi:hypothetical protein